MSPDTVVPITLTSVLFQDTYTGTVTNVTKQWVASSSWPFGGRSNCLSHAIHNASDYPRGNTSDCFLPHDSSPHWAYPLCIGAIKSVQYVIYHADDSVAAITNVTASVILTNIPYSLSPNQTDGSSSSSVGYLQTFGVSFKSVKEAFGTLASQHAANGNLVRRCGPWQFKWEGWDEWFGRALPISVSH